MYLDSFGTEDALFHNHLIVAVYNCPWTIHKSTFKMFSLCCECSCSYAGFGFAFEGEIATILGIYNPGYFDPQNTYHFSTYLFCSCSSEAHHCHTLWD